MAITLKNMGSVTAIAVASIISLVAAAQADETMTSAGALAFGPNNTFFVGDTFGGKVVAVDVSTELKDQSGYALGRSETFEGRTIIGDLKAELGELVVAAADQIVVNDVSVHQATGQIFLSGHRGLGPDALPFVATVDHGALKILDLAALDKSVHALRNPARATTLEFGQPAQSYAITDIDYFDGELFVSGVSGESFNSTLRRVRYPFTIEMEAETQIEIWHAVHAQWETRAPIIAQTIVELEGVPTLIAVYACTPLVRIPLSDLQDGAQIRGEMIGELGYGNSPVDILQFKSAIDGSQNVLVTHTHRTANQIPLSAVASAAPMPVEVGNNFGPDGLTGLPVPATGIQHIAMIDDNWAITVRPDPANPDVLQLHALLAPFFFDRADHMVEMNWPDTPDPFGYRQFPPLDF